MRLTTNASCTALMLLSCFIAANAMAAQGLTETRSMGLGNAVRATASGRAAVLLNPAGMSSSKQYLVAGLYQFRSSDKANQLNATVVDSVTSRVAAGLSYSFIFSSPDFTFAGPEGPIRLDGSEQTHEVNLALATPLASWLLLGITGKYLNHKTSVSEDELLEDFPGVSVSLTGASLSKFTMDVGGIIRLGEMFRVAVVGYNLIPADEVLYPQSLGLGAALTLGQRLTLAFDSVVDFTTDPDGTTATFHGGAETFLAQSYALRAGVEHDVYRESTDIAFGGGYVTRRLAIEVGLQQQVAGGKATLISASLQYFVQ